MNCLSYSPYYNQFIQVIHCHYIKYWARCFGFNHFLLIHDQIIDHFNQIICCFYLITIHQYFQFLLPYYYTSVFSSFLFFKFLSYYLRVLPHNHLSHSCHFFNPHSLYHNYYLNLIIHLLKYLHLFLYLQNHDQLLWFNFYCV